MVVKSGSCSLGNAGVHLLAQSGAVEKALHHGTLQRPEINAVEWESTGYKKSSNWRRVEEEWLAPLA